MSTQWPLYPTSWWQLALTGSSFTWINQSNILLSDWLFATGSWANQGFGLNNWSNYLYGSWYNFSIPAGATINGILVEIQESTPYWESIASEYSVRLVKAGTVVGNDYQNWGSLFFPKTSTYVSHWWATDLWGTTWTPSDINNGWFGIAFAAKWRATTPRTTQIDTMRITIFYTVPTSSTGFFAFF